MDAAGDAILTLLRRGDEATIVARGQSMRPLLRDGTQLRVAPLPAAAPLRIGDVVLCRIGAGLILHRVVALRSEGASLWVTTRGDGRRSEDRPVLRDAIVGRVVAATRFGRLLRLDGVGGRVVGYVAAKLLPHLWFLRKSR